MNNRCRIFKAQNGDGSVFWTGPYDVSVANGPFNVCFGIGGTASWIAWFRLFDLGNNDGYTVTLDA
jgi:hypothetical protein